MPTPLDPTALAEGMLDRLAALGADPPGITRAAFGPGEDAAHALIAEAARTLGCRVHADSFGNLHVVLPGRNPSRPTRLTGSHLDSVPHGGNLDGAAGVVAGLVALAMLDGPPSAPVGVLAFRAEEAAWFPVSYPGSLASLGRLPPAALEARRFDTGRTMAEHMTEAGLDPAAALAGRGALDPARIEGFAEVHIEQGPVLQARGEPLAIVTAIAGGLRFTDARIEGGWDHSGAVPRTHRRDAVRAFASIAAAMEAAWTEAEARGGEATVTFGEVATDPVLHGGSRIAGALRFALDIRSADPAALAALKAAAREAARAAEREHGVAVALGEPFRWPAVTMDAGLSAALDPGGALPRMVSGAGHDAASFAEAGVPTAMLLLRSRGGSHNPAEAMETADLLAAARRLAAWFAAP